MLPLLLLEYLLSFSSGSFELAIWFGRVQQLKGDGWWHKLTCAQKKGGLNSTVASDRQCVHTHECACCLVLRFVPHTGDGWQNMERIGGRPTAILCSRSAWAWIDEHMIQRLCCIFYAHQYLSLIANSCFPPAVGIRNYRHPGLQISCFQKIFHILWLNKMHQLFYKYKTHLQLEVNSYLSKAFPSNLWLVKSIIA